MANDVLFQKHFTDLDYLDRFSRYDFVNLGICKHDSSSPAAAIADLP